MTIYQNGDISQNKKIQSLATLLDKKEHHSHLFSEAKSFSNLKSVGLVHCGG